ncbi:probable serine/threonine-protein kinase cx32 chloroplastic [Phtheirospermum japonicum]|uniref:non-specific serine/threonine protein kinase n=1 Tax=Phtheirospermum japonicum TaxID=374723 RepID=A0A830C0E7_9LAMI|nr:probable serine/threonine-protein kinase cx32 chloroplastic [Phtheirospermum japonicum]
MGNCFGSQLTADPNPSTTSTLPSTPGTSRNYSNAGLSADDTPFLSGDILPTPNLKIYTYSDLKSATRSFKADMVLGVGGFGTVYKGWVDEKTLIPSKFGTGMLVAIKKLNHESVQGFDEWLSEVNFLGRLSHPNLVKLLGYCWEDKELLLVYEFMQKGSLENHLFRRGAATEPLPWDLRLKISIGAAKGLAFLHTSDKQVIYRDFKASNILLDGSYNAKISDFGLAKLGPSGGESHVTTRVMGTYGYAAPEYIATGHLYVKSDVYGFGVVLLEMLTGLRALDTRRPNGEQNLVDWKKPLLSQRRKLKAVMDARIEGQYSTKAALQAAQLTLKCLEPEPRKRPSMKEVLDVLLQIAAMEKPKDSKSRSTQFSSHHHRQSPRSHQSPFHPRHLYVKSDVYGFGVVLLEMLTGLRALDTRRPNGEQNLVDWKKSLLSQIWKLKAVMGCANRRSSIQPKSELQAAQLTLKCLEPDLENGPR